MGRSNAFQLKRLKARAPTKSIISRLKQQRLDHAAVAAHIQPFFLRNGSAPVAPALPVPSIARSLARSSLPGILPLQATARPPPPARPALRARARQSRSALHLGAVQEPSLRRQPPLPLLHKSESVSRRRRKGLKSGSRLLTPPPQGISKLHSLLEKDVHLFAIDTEFEKRGVLQHVAEIGITTLRTLDIKDVHPGKFGECWFAKAKHYHIVLTVANRGRRMQSRFGKSVLMEPNDAKTALLDIMRSCTGQDGKQHLALVGHSLESDIGALLHCPAFCLNLTKPGIENLHIVGTFDTRVMGVQARKAGARLPSLKLGPLVRHLGIDERHHTYSLCEASHLTLRGTHNASNDAAYTMMGALNFVANWNITNARHDTPDSSPE